MDEAEVHPAIDPARLKVLALEARKCAEEDEASSDKARARLFAAFCFLEMMANFDAGVLPATVSHVMTEFDLTFADGGALGAVVYLGLVLSSPIAGYFLTNLASQKNLLIAAALANALAVLSFALAPGQVTLFVGRALIGFTQAPIIIYLPVWVDEFAPEHATTMWMSMLQASVAVGIMAGYVCAGVIVTYAGEETCPGVAGSPDEIDATHGGHDGCYSPHWRMPLYIQAMGMASFAPVFYLLEGRHLNCRGGEAGRTLHAARARLYLMLKLQSLPGPAMESALASKEVVSDLVGSSSGNGSQREGDEPASPATPRGVRGWRARTLQEQQSGVEIDGSVSPSTPLARGEVREVESTQAVLGELLLTETIGIVGLFARHDKDEFGQPTGSAASDNGGGGTTAGEMSLGDQLSAMARNKLFLSLTLSLSGLYFVVTGERLLTCSLVATPLRFQAVGCACSRAILTACFVCLLLTGRRHRHSVLGDGLHDHARGGGRSRDRCRAGGAILLAFVPYWSHGRCLLWRLVHR